MVKVENNRGAEGAVLLTPDLSVNLFVLPISGELTIAETCPAAMGLQFVAERFCYAGNAAIPRKQATPKSVVLENLSV